MKFAKVALVAAICLGVPVGLGSALSQEKTLATKDQALVVSAVSDMKLKAIKSDRIGGDMKFEVTEDTLDFLKNKVVTVKSDGSLDLNQAKIG